MKKDKFEFRIFGYRILMSRPKRMDHAVVFDIIVERSARSGASRNVETMKMLQEKTGYREPADILNDIMLKAYKSFGGHERHKPAAIFEILGEK